MIHHITRASRHIIFWSLLTLAIGITAVRLFLTGVEHYKANLAVLVADNIGAPVRIGRLGANIRGFSPELILKDLAVLSPQTGQNPPIEFREIRLGINLLDLAITQELLPSSWVTLVGAKLTVKRQANGEIAIVGLKADEGQPLWLLQGGKYEVLLSTIRWEDELNPSKPLLFDRVNLAIINEGPKHKLNMIAQLPEKLGDTLTVSMDVAGNLFEPATTQGQAYISGKNLQLSELIAFSDQALPLAMSIKSGFGNVQLWANWQQHKLLKLSGELSLQQLNLSRADKGVFPAKQVDLGFSVSMDNDRRLQIDVPHFDLVKPAIVSDEVAKTHQPSQLSMNAQLAQDDSIATLGLFAERINLQHAVDVLTFFAPLAEKQISQLKQTQLQGSLNQFGLFSDLQQKTFAINGAFELQNASSFIDGVPGIIGLVGQIKGTQQAGVLRLNSHDALLNFASLFREPLSFSKIIGELNWQQTEQDWQLATDDLQLDSLSFQSRNRLRMTFPKSNAPVFMDLQNNFVAGDVSQAGHFYPTSIMDKNVVTWLDNAFVSGRISKGDMLFYGNLKDFSFNKGQGVFEVLFTFDDLELAYHPDWPHISQISADVTFERDSVQVLVHQGQTEQLAIKETEVTIPSMNTSKHLLIKGEVEGEIAQVLGFMQKTPLNTPVDAVLDTLTPQGNTQVTLDLAIPLVDHAPTKVDGSARLSNAELNIKALDLRVNKITGALKFNEKGVFSDTISAVALAKPIQINIKSSAINTAVNVAGRVDMKELQTQFNLPLNDIAEGVADYQLTLTLPYDSEPPELQVESNMVGVALKLPGDLAKRQQQQKPLSLAIGMEGKAMLPLTLRYDNQLKAALLLDSQRHSLYSGHVVVGEGKAAFDQEPGVSMEINRDRLSLQEWLSGASLLQQPSIPVIAGNQQASSPGAQIKKIALRTDHALWKSADIGSFDLTLQHQGQDWTGTIDSAVAKGKMLMPADLAKGVIKLDMTSLDLNALKQLKSVAKEQVLSLSPIDMPLFTLTSQQTFWQTANFGQLIIETERITGGIGFKHIEISGKGQKLLMTGDWKDLGGQRSATRLQGHVDMPDASKTIAQLGISKDFAEASGNVEFKLNWPSAPYQFALAELRGQVDISLKNGRILSIEPGFGRVLGVLAVAQWLKRLQLDFSDVYGEGMSFDSINGHFELLNGKAVTKDLLVDAVPAKITITGETDLVNRTGEHVVNVTPKSADAVPIAGTIMGKVAALVGQTLTGKNQEGFFFGSQYLVKGAWANAQIIPLHENDGLLQKTWNGLTDFSWMQPKNKQQER